MTGIRISLFNHNRRNSRNDTYPTAGRSLALNRLKHTFTDQNS